MPGLEHLFAGLVQGVGEGQLESERHKRDETEKEREQQLSLLTGLLSMPDIDPEVRSQLFKSALTTASNGNKKLVDNIHGLLGPILQQGGGQTGGVRPPSGGSDQGKAVAQQQPAPSPQPQGGGDIKGDQPMGSSAPSAPLTGGLQKFGSSGERSIFQTPQQQTDLMAQRAGAVQQAQGDVAQKQDMDTYREKMRLETEQKTKEGWKLTGFTAPNKTTGLSSAIYENPFTQQVKIGTEQVPHFLTAEGISTIATQEAAREQARQETIRNLAVGSAKDPQNPTPAELKAAERSYGKLVSQDMSLGIEKTKSEIFENYGQGKHAAEASTNEKIGLNQNQQLLDYNRQRDDYVRDGQIIDAKAQEVEGLKAKAGEAFNQAQSIQAYLLQNKVKRGDEDVTAQQSHMTWADYDYFNAQGKTLLGQAQAQAQGAGSSLKGKVEVGKDAQGWPYIKDLRDPFSYSPASSFPDMPQRGGAEPEIDGIPKSRLLKAVDNGTADPEADKVLSNLLKRGRPNASQNISNWLRDTINSKAKAHGQMIDVPDHIMQKLFQ